MAEDTRLLAVLIDADNTSPKYAKAIFDEIASLGEASVRRVYGDFASQQISGWSKISAEFGLVPHHSPANTVGKNSSDISLVMYWFAVCPWPMNSQPRFRHSSTRKG